MARAEIQQIHHRQQLPILVGGTGMYLRTLLDGIAPIPAIDPEVRREVRGEKLRRLVGLRPQPRFVVAVLRKPPVNSQAEHQTVMVLTRQGYQAFVSPERFHQLHPNLPA